MAHSTLPVLAHPDFPRVFSRAIDQMVTRAFVQPELHSCDYEDAFCDCREAAVVHDLATEFEYCVRHFLAVNRG
jgi:hypothetical protein